VAEYENICYQLLLLASIIASFNQGKNKSKDCKTIDRSIQMSEVSIRLVECHLAVIQVTDLTQWLVLVFQTISPKKNADVALQTSRRIQCLSNDCSRGQPITYHGSARCQGLITMAYWSMGGSNENLGQPLQGIAQSSMIE